MGAEVTLLYRIEAQFGPSWNPVKVRLDGQHNFARRVEWHDSLSVATEYAKREAKADAERYPHAEWRRYKFRVVDHLGETHWTEERAAA